MADLTDSRDTASGQRSSRHSRTLTTTTAPLTVTDSNTRTFIGRVISRVTNRAITAADPTFVVSNCAELRSNAPLRRGISLGRPGRSNSQCALCYPGFSSRATLSRPAKGTVLLPSRAFSRMIETPFRRQSWDATLVTAAIRFSNSRSGIKCRHAGR